MYRYVCVKKVQGIIEKLRLATVATGAARRLSLADKQKKQYSYKGTTESSIKVVK